MKVGFISDFFSSDLLGGAELNDEVLIAYLNKKFDVIKIACRSCTISKIEELDFIIISNFVELSEENKNYIIANKSYIIYEHDHKYVSTRDPSRFKNFKIPIENLVNRPLYRFAKKVICLSKIQTKILNESAQIENCVSIGTSLWNPDTLTYINSLDKTKNKKAAIVKSNNPIKNTATAERYCKSKQINYDLISANDSKEFLKILSKYETLVFIPGVLESLCRLVVEAKMLNCKIITKKKMIGASYEDWFNMSGPELVEKISENICNALLLFENTILESKNEK